jgi:hypothetical protein
LADFTGAQASFDRQQHQHLVPDGMPGLASEYGSDRSYPPNLTLEECKQLLQTCRLRVKLKGIRSKMLDGVMHGLVVRWANDFVASVNPVRQSRRQSLG